MNKMKLYKLLLLLAIGCALPISLSAQEEAPQEQSQSNPDLEYLKGKLFGVQVGNRGEYPYIFETIMFEADSVCSFIATVQWKEDDKPMHFRSIYEGTYHYESGYVVFEVKRGLIKNITEGTQGLIPNPSLKTMRIKVNPSENTIVILNKKSTDDTGGRVMRLLQDNSR